MGLAEENLVPSPRARNMQLPPCSRVHNVSEITCLSCMAAQQGLNCWQVATSSCCKRDRSQCQNCSIYVRIRKAGTVIQEVTICLKDGGSLRGQIHVAGTQRLSDYLNGSELFLALTKVQWAEPDKDEVPVLFVAKDHVASIQPLGEYAPSHNSDNPHQDDQ